MTRAEERAIEHDCARLIALYANLIDACEWEAVAELFAPDGRMSRPTEPDTWVEGREAILEGFRARLPRKTRHLCTNLVVTVVTDAEARGESAMALFLSNEVCKVGRFEDRFVLTSAGWRFAERRGTLTF